MEHDLIHKKIKMSLLLNNKVIYLGNYADFTKLIVTRTENGFSFKIIEE